MKQNTSKILLVFLATVLMVSAIMPIGNSIISNSIYAPSLSGAKNWGDLNQYEWNAVNGNENQTGFSAGPGPDRPDILWTASVSGANGYVAIFNGLAIVLAGRNVIAFDAYTGQKVWNTTLLIASASRGTATKIDDTYFFVDCNGPEVHRISDGTFVANYTVPYWSYMGGGSQYFPGAWSSTLKMKWGISFDGVTKKGLINAVSLADPTHPTLAWTFTADEASEISTYGDGKVLVGTTSGAVYALDGKTGAYLWRAPKTGVAQQHGVYDGNGHFLESSSSQTITCWNTSGAVQWEYDSNVLGTRSYFAMNGGSGYGRYYHMSIATDPHGWVGCWSIETGELLWKQPGYYNIAYSTPAIADGKVYATTCDQPAGRATSTLVMPGYSTGCFDAFTGELLWSLPNINIASPSIGCGNLYGIYGGIVYCIGSNVKNWNFGYEGNLLTPRVLVGSGPSDLSQPRWVFNTGDKVAGSPAVVDGKVYVGSEDRNWYCLNAYTGQKIWNFTVGWRIGSSAAVVNGKVFTGSDDGNFYCLDANTGTKLWQASGGGLITYIIMPQMLQSRSSPIIVGDSLYCGSLDGKVYCLNTANGNVKWTYSTGGPIGGSPVYANGTIYITSTDTYLYALDATSGAFKFKTIPLNLDVYTTPDKGSRWDVAFFSTATPVVANGLIYIDTGVTMGGLWPASKYAWPGNPSPGGANGGALRFSAFNATTGESVWNMTMAGNSGTVWQPCYYKGNLYMVEFMQVTCMSASNPSGGNVAIRGFMGQPCGNRTWAQWIGYEILSSPTYVDDLRGPKIYVSSDVGSITCLNATSGAPISAYQTSANAESSCAVWEGKLYVGSSDRNVYCFDDSPIVDMSVEAQSSKGSAMFSGETITIGGHLKGNPMETTWDYGSSTYVHVASDMHPGVPFENVTVSINKPDGTTVNLTTTTDMYGKFSVSYSPSETGAWGWVAFYDGKRTPGIQYNQAYTDWNPLEVIAGPTSATPTIAPTPETETPTPTPTIAPVATPTPAPASFFADMTTVLIIAAVVVIIVVVAVAAYMTNRRRKKPAA